jgi:hypothetical protein
MPQELVARDRAVIEIEERRSQVLETMVSHVTTTGARYITAP